MDIYKSIELYTGINPYTKLNFSISGVGDNLIIGEWDEPDIKRPTMEQLYDIYNSWALIEKMKMIRDVRDSILNRASWITEVRSNEDTALSMNWSITRTFPDELYAAYLLWKVTMRDVPQTVTGLESINIEDITPENTDIFPPCPISLELTKL